MNDCTPVPGFENRIQQNFDNNKFLHTAGGRLSVVQPGKAEIEAPFDEKLTQQDGFLHAGVITALVDTACGYAAYSLMPPDARVMSVEFKINNLLPARGERFVARGRVIKSGKTLTICEGNLYGFQGGEKCHIAVMQATMICIT